MVRLGAWTGIALLVAYLVFVGGGWLGIYSSELRLVSVALVGIVLVAWAAAALRDPQWLPRSRLLPALFLALGSLAVSTAFSRDQRVSVEYLGYAVLLVALYLLMVRLLAVDFFANRLMTLSALLFAVVALEFVVAVAYLWMQWWGYAGRITLPPLRPFFIGLSYGNPSAVLTMVALLGVPAAFRIPRQRRLLGTTIVVAVVAVVALLSGSRAGWLALAVAGIVGLILGALAPYGRAMIERRSGFRLSSPSSLRGLLAAGAVAVAVTLGVLVMAPAVLSRIDAGGQALRAGYAVVALRLFASAPILGTGPGSWVVERVATTQLTETNYYIPHAHDVPLQTLAELGVVGAGAGLFLIVSVVRLLLEAWRGEDGNRRWLAWLAAVALVYFAVHNLLDFYPNMPPVLFAAALPIAYLDAKSLPVSTERRSIWPTLAVRAGAVACAVAVAGLLLQEIPASMDERAVSAAVAGDWETASTLSRTALASDGGIHVYDMTAGLAAAHLGDPAEAAQDFQVVAVTDDLPEAWLDLASSDLDLGRTADAETATDAAMRIGVQRAVVSLPAGDLYLKLDRPDKARAAFAAALANEPSVAGDPWWTADASRAAAYQGALADAATSMGTSGWALWLMAGRTDAARAATEDLTAQRIIAAWSGDASASAALFANCRSQPLDVSALSWCAAIAVRRNDERDASDFRGLAEGSTPGSSEASYLLRVGVIDARHAPSQSYALFWGTYTYRRPTPNDLLVPELPHLVYG